MEKQITGKLEELDALATLMTDSDSSESINSSLESTLSDELSTATPNNTAATSGHNQTHENPAVNLTESDDFNKDEVETTDSDTTKIDTDEEWTEDFPFFG